MSSQNRPASLGGVGLRYKHYQDILEQRPSKIGWFEIHPENYFGGGPSLYYLTKIREHYPLSFHGVGLSLGSDQEPDRQYLQSLKDLIKRFEPFQFSDHVSWSVSGNAHLNDLLPLPYTPETLDRLCRNIEITQEFLGQEILVENPSTYLQFKEDVMGEPDLLNALVKRTGCHLLLDINNVFVQSHNHHFNPYEYVDTVNLEFVREIHLAGHTERVIRKRGREKEVLLVDTHNRHVCQKVWDLYAYTVKKRDPVLTLIEWDQDFPTFRELCEESYKAQDIMEQAGRKNVA